MKNVLEIENAIKQLPRDAYGQLRQWLDDYEVEQELGASSASVSDMLDEEDGGGDQMSSK